MWTVPSLTQEGSVGDVNAKGLSAEPSASTQTQTVPEPPKNEKKPRCLYSLLGWYAKKKVTSAVENFNLPYMPNFRKPPGDILGGGDDVIGGVEVGGNLGPTSPFAPGLGQTPSFSPGLSQASPFAPGLGQAMDALNNAHNLEDQVNAANSQLQSQLGGGFNRFPKQPQLDVPSSFPSFLRDDVPFGVHRTYSQQHQNPLNLPLFHFSQNQQPAMFQDF